MKTHLRKLRVNLDKDGNAEYFLKLFNVNDYNGEIPMNSLVGSEIRFRWTGDIRCVVHGEKLNKTFGEGFCWNAFQNAAQASPCIIHPEQCRIHEGIALRGDLEWELENHNIPHVVYLSYTSGIKVGITSSRNKMTRWIDQGARSAIVVAEVPYRQLAGEIEVLLKNFVADKSNWKGLLQPQFAQLPSLVSKKEELLYELPEGLQSFISDDDRVFEINYPCSERPVNPVSYKLIAGEWYEGKLKGIVGQYLILDNQRVINLRSHTGYELEWEIS